MLIKLYDKNCRTWGKNVYDIAHIVAIDLDIKKIKNMNLNLLRAFIRRNWLDHSQFDLSTNLFLDRVDAHTSFRSMHRTVRSRGRQFASRTRKGT